MLYFWLIRIPLLLLLLSVVSGCGGVNPVQKDIELTQQQAFEIQAAKQKVKGLEPSFLTETSYPYVITGDLTSKELLFWKGRIQRSQLALKGQFFKRDPSKIVTIWLFKNADSYSKNNLKYWEFTPNTPYGYFLPSANRMVMNVATGGGTLTHELVHPYITENFPESPLWFHEGLASLYEQSRYSGGKIYGMNNWRLRSLQASLIGKSLPSLSTMMSSGSDFYGANRELYYAQARYLMFYLQSKGLLEVYYIAYSEGVLSDPWGTKALLKVTGEKSMQSLESKWFKFVLNQRY